MKRLSLFICFLCMVLTASALDKRQAEINRIKKSKEYLYSDITMPTLEGAVSQAFDELQQEILFWIMDRADKKEGLIVSPRDINTLIDTIMVRRLDMYRVFAYVKKVKLAAFYADWNIVLDENLDCDDGRLPQVDVPERPLLPDSIAPSDSIAKDSVVSEKVLSLLKNYFLGKKGGVIEQLKRAKNFFELKEIMEPLKLKGDILDYGKYATAKNPEDCYLIVYDPAGNIRAFLGKGKEERQNLKTGKLDSIENYHGCGAIWFRIKAPSDFPQGLRSAEEKQL